MKDITWTPILNYIGPILSEQVRTFGTSQKRCLIMSLKIAQELNMKNMKKGGKFRTYFLS